MAMPITFGYASDPGQVRENNEDAVVAFFSGISNDNNRPPFGLFAVADGMGGHMNGEKASAAAVELLVDEVVRRVYLRLFTSDDEDFQLPIGEVMESAIEAANDEINRKVPDGGTTITAAVVMGNLAYIAHVGDSRAYLVTDDEIEQITEDHSFVNQLVKMGTMTAEEAEQSGQANKIYKALGIAETVEVDKLTRRFKPGVRLLLCSDGLTGEIKDDVIHQTVAEAATPQAACDRLVEIANDNGAQDNVTVAIVSMHG
jgi:PPM family protein phosphatase